jgi:uncharacterized protein (TIGR03067 family)
MVRRACLSLILGVLTATVSSGFAPAPVYREPPQPKVPDVYALMQGTWEIDQNVIRLKGIKRIQQQIHIQGSTWRYIFDNNGVKTERTRYQIVLAPKASPATLDLKHPNQLVQRRVPLPGGGFGLVELVVMKGIVQVDADTLTFSHVYWDQKNTERPKRFVAGKEVLPDGTTRWTISLRRVK